MNYNIDNTDWSTYFDNPNDNNLDDEDVKVGFEFRPMSEVIAEEKNQKLKIPKSEKNDLLKIIAYPTNKSKLKQRPMMKEGIIPKHPSRMIFNGKSGSGKSNLLINLMTQPHFYGRTKRSDPKSQYFDLVFLFSPTADGQDDLVKFLELPEKRICTNFDEEALNKIFDVQDSIIKEKGLDKAPKILIIFDDIQSDAKFMRSKSFTRAFIQGRHCNMSIAVCCQSWTKLPRVCRLQGSDIFFFPSSQSEVEVVSEEYCPPNTTKKQFRELVQHATGEQYQFLYISCNSKPEKRFRKNLDTILSVSK